MRSGGAKEDTGDKEKARRAERDGPEGMGMRARECVGMSREGRAGRRPCPTLRDFVDFDEGGAGGVGDAGGLDGVEAGRERDEEGGV